MHRQRGWKRKKTGEEMYFFHCLSNSRKARGSCESFMMPEHELKNTVLKIIQVHAGVIVGNSLKLIKNSNETDKNRENVKTEIAALRLEADKNGRMFKSLYESLVSGLINADEYREMRGDYEAKVNNNLARAAELENRQAELDRQIAEYIDLSDLITDTENNGITAKLIDCLVGNIRIFSDRSIKIDFLFDKGFDMINEVVGE
jgi:uncharacterized protein YeeX (DUF496 family)